MKTLVFLCTVLVFWATSVYGQGKAPKSSFPEGIQVNSDGTSTLRLKGLDIEFDKQGAWTKIYSTYTQAVDFPDRRGIEKAQVIAEEKGKAQIIRFFNQQVESDRLVEEVDSAVQNASRTQSSDAKESLSRTTQRTMIESVKEFTHSYASGNLRGVTILETGYNEKAEEAWVKIGISRKTIAVSQEVQQSIKTGEGPSSKSGNTQSQGVQTQPSEVRTGRELPQ